MICPHCGKFIPDEQPLFPNMQVLAGLKVIVTPFAPAGAIIVSATDWDRIRDPLGEIEKTTAMIKDILEKGNKDEQ